MKHESIWQLAQAHNARFSNYNNAASLCRPFSIRFINQLLIWFVVHTLHNHIIGILWNRIWIIDCVWSNSFHRLADWLPIHLSFCVGMGVWVEKWWTNGPHVGTKINNFCSLGVGVTFNSLIYFCVYSSKYSMPVDMNLSFWYEMRSCGHMRITFRQHLWSERILLNPVEGKHFFLLLPFVRARRLIRCFTPVRTQNISAPDGQFKIECQVQTDSQRVCVCVLEFEIRYPPESQSVRQHSERFQMCFRDSKCK